jgi:hypothetical protein
MKEQLQNWESFCQFHTGDWYGATARYQLDGEEIASWQVVTKLLVSNDGNEIHHQDCLIFADGETEVKTFGPYLKPKTNALFLGSSFCWGSKQVSAGAPFLFEIGFRVEDWRALMFTKYDANDDLNYVSFSFAHLHSFAEAESQDLADATLAQWWGWRSQTISPDWIVSTLNCSAYQPLQDLSDDSLTLHLPHGIAVHCPKHIAVGQDFAIAAEWQSHPTQLQRGIGSFSSSCFTHFTLEEFRSEPM